MKANTTGMRLRYLRKERGKKQLEIAELISCKAPVYRRYESGERSVPLDTLVFLAKYYGVSVDFLAGLTNWRTPYPD